MERELGSPTNAIISPALKKNAGEIVPISPAFKKCIRADDKSLRADATTSKAVHVMPERDKRQINVCSWKSTF